MVLLLLPLGEGWGEVSEMLNQRWCFPHPSLLPKGEGTRQAGISQSLL